MDKTLGQLVARDVDLALLQEDLDRIAQVAAWPRASLRIALQAGQGNQAAIKLINNVLEIEVAAAPGERSATLYNALHKLGFLFPHPRWQISPSFAAASAYVNATFEWAPSAPWRGFHFHTQHPNEWVHGFFMDQPQIARDSIYWLVRNRQNVMQMTLLRNLDWAPLADRLQEAKDWGLQVGVSLSFSMIQQKSFHLLDFWRAFTGVGATKQLSESLQLLHARLPLDFLTVELGSSEFTSLSYAKTLQWLEQAGAWHQQNKKEFFVKVHVSSNQTDKKFGNYNFLPEHCSANVGVHVHTVFVYALEDNIAPMYGRANFLDLRDFLLRQKDTTWKRTTWYFPETSYYIGLDIDVPLLLTDYLQTRHRDWQFVRKHGVQGNINFSTGQELGYWLMDWCAALGADASFRGPLAAVESLGESTKVWSAILAFQTKYFFQLQGIASLVGSNLMDELPGAKPIHARNLLKNLRHDQVALDAELLLLDQMRNDLPDLSGVKCLELQILLKITWLRVQHSYWVRRALKDKTCLENAVQVRLLAQDLVTELKLRFERYSEAKLFELQSNPTSYQYGYAWTVQTLHYWFRDEEMIRYNRFDPFFKNIYNIWKLLF